MGKSVVQKKDQKKIIHNDLEERIGNEDLFLNLHWKNTSRQKDIIKLLLASLVTTLASVIHVLSFPIFMPSNQNKFSLERQNPKLKYRIDLLEG